MDIDKLRVFLGIIDTGSMTSAAKQMHLTQPALSRAVKSLEDDVGSPLFERVGRGLVLSQVGRAFESDARSIVENVDKLSRKVRNVSKKKYFDLRVGAIDSVVMRYFPQLIHRVRGAYPGIGIKIIADRSADLMRRLLADEFDIIVVALTDPPTGVRATKTRPYILRFYGSKEEFKSLASIKEYADLSEFPMVNLASKEGAVHKDCMTKSDSYALTNSMASMKSLVLSGFGVGALVEFMLTKEEKKQLVEAPFSNEHEHCHLYVVGHSEKSSDLQLQLEKLIARELEA